MLEEICIFVVLYLRKGGETCQLMRGILCLVLSIYGGFVPPCRSVNAPAALAV